MFIVEDRRQAKLEVGMVIQEYINGEFNREFIINDLGECDTLKDSCVDITGVIINKLDYPYARNFFKNRDFINESW